MDCRIYSVLQRKLIWRLRQRDKRRKWSSVLTVAGPMIVTPFLSAVLISLRVRASGMPSAIMAMVRICIKIKKTISTPQCCHPNKLCRTEKADNCSQSTISFCLVRPLGGHAVHCIIQEGPVPGSAVYCHLHSSFNALFREFLSPPCTLEQHCIFTNPK